MEGEIDISEVPLTPGGVNHDFKKVRKYEWIRFDPILSWRTETLLEPESPPLSYDEPNQSEPLTNEDMEILLNSPMIEVRKKRSKALTEPRFKPFTQDALDTSEGWHKNYQKNKRNTIAVMRRLSVGNENEGYRKSLPSTRSTRQYIIDLSPENENIPPVEDVMKQELDLLIASIYESRPLLNNEYSRLNAAIIDWKHILQSEPDVPPEEQGSIQSTVGRARILLDKRFKATFDVLDKAETFADNEGKIINESDKEYKPDDVYAFVDLLITEIKNIDNELNRLLLLRQNNWINKDETIEVPKEEKRVIKKKNHTKVKSKLNIENLRKKFANVEKDESQNFPSGKRTSRKDSILVSDSGSPLKPESTKEKTPKKTIRSNCIIKSATGTPVHCDTPRPRRTNSVTKQLGSELKKRAFEDNDFTAPIVQPKKARHNK